MSSNNITEEICFEEDCVEEIEMVMCMQCYDKIHRDGHRTYFTGCGWLCKACLEVEHRNCKKCRSCNQEEEEEEEEEDATG